LGTGTDCCKNDATLAVTVANTLHSGVFYRDWRFALSAGGTLTTGLLGVELRALAENPARRYWVQVGARSGTALDGEYSEAAWKQHQLIALEDGQGWDASGERIERRQLRGRVIYRTPA